MLTSRPTHNMSALGTYQQFKMFLPEDFGTKCRATPQLIFSFLLLKYINRILHACFNYFMFGSFGMV